MKKWGEICWVNFDSLSGQEVKKKRPAVIVSNNVSYKYLKRMFYSYFGEGKKNK